MTRSFICVFATIGVLIAGVKDPAVAQKKSAAERNPLGVTQLLQLYEDGDFDAVWQALESAVEVQVDTLRDALKREGEAWINAAGNEQRDRRRLTAAVFALELSGAALDQHWAMAQEILEWACRQMRLRRRGTDVERTFHLAAIAVIEGAGDVKALDLHVGHVRSRFSNEPRILLARAYKSEREYWRLYRTIAGGVDGGAPSIVAPALKRAAERRENTREVALRLGFLALQKDLFDVALAELAKVPPGDDPGQLYLAHLMTGWVHEKLKKPAEAEAAYRRALATVPLAQSAVLHLAAILYETDKRDEANLLVEQMLAADPPPQDPWRIYGYGDYRRLPLLIEQLRKAMQ